MSLKIKGSGLADNSENVLIKQIKFTDPYQKISNADVNVLNLGNDKTWMRAYDVSTFTGSDDGSVNADSITLEVLETDSVTGTSPRTIISNNVINPNLSEAEKLVYYNDVVRLTATSNKGYGDPTVSGDITVSGDVSIDDHVSGGSVMSISKPRVLNTPTYDTYFTTKATDVVIVNDNDLAVSVKYATSSSSGGTSNEFNDAFDLDPGEQKTLTISAQEIEPAASNPKKYVTIKFIYGAAASTYTCTLNAVDSTPTNSFDKSTLNLLTGQTGELTVSMSSGDIGSIFITSDNVSVATADPRSFSGTTHATFTVTAVSAGTATMTAECSVEVGLYDTASAGTATCTINVYDTVYCEFSPILSKTTHELEKGTSFTKLNKASSNGTVTYSSSDPSVASVDSSSGDVQALKTGTATITATAIGGGGLSTASDYYNVSVVASSQPFISCSIPEVELEVGDTFQLSYYITASGSVVYTSSMPNVCSVGSSTGKLIAQNKPNTTAVITAQLAGYPDQKVTVTVYVVEAGYNSGSGGGSSSGGCVSGDTPILSLNDKYIPAKAVKLGDYIVCATATGDLIKTKIINKYDAIVDKTYDIIFDDNSKLSVTGNHPILNIDHYANIEGVNGYDTLHIGDMVTTIKNNKKIIDIISINKQSIVYNFYTEYDNFIANDVVVACENPEEENVGYLCFDVDEGVSGSSVHKDYGGGCVSADTNILMLNFDTKHAEDIRCGNIVMVYDQNRNIVPAKIINRYYTITRGVYEIKLEDNTVLSVTANHPVLTSTEYKNIDGVDNYAKLEIGDMVITRHGDFKVKDIVYKSGKQKVYNFYTEYDNFIANDVVVACENPEKQIVGVTCFGRHEGISVDVPLKW